MSTWSINDVAFDSAAKEIVKITNMICTRCAAGDATHQFAGCTMVPNEAVALRVVGVTKSKDPIVAYTYRHVNPEYLTKVDSSRWVSVNSIRPSRIVGRI